MSTLPLVISTDDEGPRASGLHRFRFHPRRRRRLAPFLFCAFLGWPQTSNSAAPTCSLPSGTSWTSPRKAAATGTQTSITAPRSRPARMTRLRARPQNSEQVLVLHTLPGFSIFTLWQFWHLWQLPSPEHTFTLSGYPPERLAAWPSDAAESEFPFSGACPDHPWSPEHSRVGSRRTARRIRLQAVSPRRDRWQPDSSSPAAAVRRRRSRQTFFRVPHQANKIQQNCATLFALLSRTCQTALSAHFSSSLAVEPAVAGASSGDSTNFHPRTSRRCWISCVRFDPSPVHAFVDCLLPPRSRGLVSALLVRCC
jgi:hypothetical protein